MEKPTTVFGISDKTWGIIGILALLALIMAAYLTNFGRALQ